MKSSNYNTFIKQDVEWIAHNGLTNALAVLSNKEMSDFNLYINTGNGLTIEQINEFKENGFLIDDNFNEIEFIRYNMYKDRFDKSALALVIAPTSNCNFRCPYCFESKVLRNCRMDDSVKQAVIDFVESKMNTIERLSIVWYGGEPLLEIGLISEFSKIFIELCERNNVVYSANIITNGYLLTSEVLEQLIQYKVTDIQITIDGMNEEHDSRRYLVGKKPTFEKIIHNLLSLESVYKKYDDFPFIAIRMNVDKKNVSQVDSLLEYIYSMPFKDYVFFYIAGVYDKEDRNFDTTLSQAEFIDVYRKYLRKLKEFSTYDNYELYYPKLISAACGCEQIATFVIDADGSLYKCWEEIGQSSAKIGNVKDMDSNSNNEWLYKYLIDDPTQKEKCHSCKILPNCMGGGCPHRVKKSNFKIDCEAKRNEHIASILDSYKLLKNNEVAE